jgi:hypothetical protein
MIRMSRPAISSGLRLEAPNQLFVADGGAEIGKQAQVLAQAEDGLLRTQRTVQLVVLPVADSAEKYRVGLFGQLQGGFWQRVPVCFVGGAAHQGGFHFERQVQYVEDLHGLGDDFGANAVTRQNCDLHLLSFL